VMIQKRDEVSDGALKVDVVFPKGIVGVNEQVLTGWKAMRERGHGHMIPF